ncbi:MAG: hypothetical protein WC501_00340 [Candidatus Micrarchaeia archaeon]
MLLYAPKKSSIPHRSSNFWKRVSQYDPLPKPIPDSHLAYRIFFQWHYILTSLVKEDGLDQKMDVLLELSKLSDFGFLCHTIFSDAYLASKQNEKAQIISRITSFNLLCDVFYELLELLRQNDFATHIKIFASRSLELSKEFEFSDKQNETEKALRILSQLFVFSGAFHEKDPCFENGINFLADLALHPESLNLVLDLFEDITLILNKQNKTKDHSSNYNTSIPRAMPISSSIYQFLHTLFKKELSPQLAIELGKLLPQENQDVFVGPDSIHLKNLGTPPQIFNSG